MVLFGSKFAVSSVASTVFPGSGLGDVTAARAANGAASIYTLTTVTPTSTTGIVAGDYVATPDGFWAAVVSVAAGVVTIDKWRNYADILNGTTPASPSTAIFHSKCGLVGARDVRLEAINIITATHAGDILIITDASGLTSAGHVLKGPFTIPANPGLVSFTFGGEFGNQIPGPFGINLSAVTTTVDISYIPLASK